MKTLWVVPKWPYPAHDGARQATLALLGSVAPHLGEVTIAVFTNDAPSESEKEKLIRLGVRKILLLKKGSPLRVKIIAAIRGRPLTLEPFSSASPKILQDYGLVIFDGLHSASSFLEHKEKGQTWIYRSHNVESDLWLQASQSNSYSWPMRKLLEAQEKKVKSTEQRLLRNCELTAVISPRDAIRYREIAGTRSEPLALELVPFAPPCPASVPEFPVFSPSPVVGFLGKMDWAPNRQGLEWFLENVWKKSVQKRPELLLKIAGSGEDRWLRDLASADRSIELMGEVENAEQLFRPSWITIAPILFGSGTRIKVLESARFARATLGTSIGMQGSGLESESTSYVSDKEEEWVDLLVKLDYSECKSKGLQCFDYFRSELSAETIGRRFLESISRHRPGEIIL